RLGQGEVGGAGADAQGRTGGGHEVAPARTASCSRRWAAICSRVSTSCSAGTARAALTWQQLWPQTSSTAPSSVTAIRSREGSRCSCTMSASAATKRGSVPEVATRRKASCCSWAVSFASVSRSQITSTWSVTQPIGTTITASAWSSAATRAMTSLPSGSSQGTCEPEEGGRLSLGGLSRLGVQLPDPLYVVGDEADRHHDHRIGLVLRRDPRDDVVDVRLQPGHVRGAGAGLVDQLPSGQHGQVVVQVLHDVAARGQVLVHVPVPLARRPRG